MHRIVIILVAWHSCTICYLKVAYSLIDEKYLGGLSDLPCSYVVTFFPSQPLIIAFQPWNSTESRQFVATVHYHDIVILPEQLSD